MIAKPAHASTAALAVGALGVVFGDIGTSPLYTLKACFDMSGANASLPADVLGIASLPVWTLVVAVCLKYVTFIMRIDHDGEGGILALLATSGTAVTRRQSGTLRLGHRRRHCRRGDAAR